MKKRRSPSGDQPSARLGLLTSLLHPIQELLCSSTLGVLPSRLRAAAGRREIVAVTDALLVRQVPLARLVPPEARQRLIRRQLDLIVDEILLNDALPGETIGTGVESIILTIDAAAPDPAAQATLAAREVLGPDWTVAPLPLNDRSFQATPAGPVQVQDAWTFVHKLKAQPGIAHAEPNIIVPLQNAPAEAPPALGAKSLFGTKHLPGSARHEWSIEAIRAKQAWQKAATDGRATRGEGILVGHPDTGYTRHVEIWSDSAAKRRLIFEAGWDFWKNDNDPTDDMTSTLGSLVTAGMLGNAGHGTATSSVIFSDERGPNPAAFVTGVAPRARLVPFRVAPTVVVWDQRRLADAIKAATDAGCHVISISMGGLPLNYLQQAVIYAVNNGVIVCAAAGNVFGANDTLHAVVWPAAYSEVLAVAASNVEGKTWSGSSRGPQVDITAPGESVWHARARKGKPLRELDRGKGTSFAVATTAGVAALWLAYHGRDQLIARYGKARIASVFRQVVVTHGFNRPANWKTHLFGAGIIDALKVLSAPLPSPTAMPMKAMRVQAQFDRFASLFDEIPRIELRRALARLLGVTEPQLPGRLEEIGDELLFHFFSDGELRERFRREAKSRGVLPKTAAKTAPRNNTAEGLLAIASPDLAARIT